MADFNIDYGSIEEKLRNAMNKLPEDVPQESEKERNQKIAEKLHTLKLRKEAAKIYNTSSGDPEMQSAAQELIQKLRTPQEKRVDFSPLFALASSGVRGALLKAHKPIESDEDRLAKAASLELTQQKLQQALISNRLKQQSKLIADQGKKEDKERQEIRTKLVPILNGTVRSPLVREQETAINNINYMENQIQAAMEDVSPIVEADKYNLSTIWSRVLSNAAPTQTLIEKSIYRSAKNAYDDAKEWVYGKRKQSTYSKADLAQMVSQLKILKAAKLQARSTTISRSVRGYSDLLKKYPDVAEGIRAEYGDYVDIDANGVPKRKEYDPYTGNEIGSIEQSAEQTNKLEQFKNLLMQRKGQ